MRPSRTCARALLCTLVVLLLSAAPRARAGEYTAGDDGQRPDRSSTTVLPETFLRGFDPVTVYFPGNVGPGPARVPGDDAQSYLRISPKWPGAYLWVDRRTLQFRPAEPWPALQRFAIDARGSKKILTTMMAAPASMAPASGTTDLAPFRTFHLSFPQALPLSSLRQMLTLEIRQPPGLADSKRVRVKSYGLSLLPRASERDAAVYALTLEDDVPEGKVLDVQVSLALGEQGKTLWTGRLATRPAFHVDSVVCGDAQASTQGGASLPQGMVLACGNKGEAPELRFSAAVKDLSLTNFRKLVSLEPSVTDLHFEPMGNRVALRGHFIPDTLYRLQLHAAPIADESGRALQDPGNAELFFHLGWRAPFVRFDLGNVLIEKNGPRMLPLTGYGDPRADVRIYRVDPLFTGLWPFPARPVELNEEAPPPFPGAEPKPRTVGTPVQLPELERHLRLLGTPLLSRVVDLPLAPDGSTTRFGLDLGPLLDSTVGVARPGTYLVGLRRLTGEPIRSYVRVQVTNLSLSTVEEPLAARFFVRTLDRGDAVGGATITLEGMDAKSVPVSLSLKTDGGGMASLTSLDKWASLDRVSVRSGDDVLVIDPGLNPPPAFADNHWGAGGGNWLRWLMRLSTMGTKPNDQRLGFLFTERPIYRPGEKVYLKGYVRERRAGQLLAADMSLHYVVHVEGEGGATWDLPVKSSALGGVEAQFQEKDAPTGNFSASLQILKAKGEREVVATRSFRIEAYRIPTFEVQLTGAPQVPLDTSFNVQAVARYYAGGVVAKQPIQWTVTRRPYLYQPPGHEGFLFASSTQFSREGNPRAAERQVETKTLDAQGSAKVTVNPQLDLDGSARIYHFEATVTGADNQQVTNVTETRALPPFVMGMKVPRYQEEAKSVTPQILALGVDGKPLANQAITVRFFRRVWHSHLRETAFATGDAKYVTEQEDVKLEERNVTTQVGVISPSFPVREPGVYVLELVGRDKLGRVQTLNADLYIGGKGAVAWSKPRDGVFNVSPDKAKYRPGETAKLVLQSPYQSAHALVVLEEPGGNRYLWKDVSGGKATVEVKIAPTEAPNLPVHVLLMRGRVGVPKSGSDTRYQPATVAASLDLNVEPTANELLVHVEHPETARPGNTVEMTLTLKDDQKRPLGGEVTLWLVDEAVLSLAHEASLDPIPEFVPTNRRTSTLRDTRNWVTGRIEQREEEPGGDGTGDGEGTGSGKHVVRRNFQTVPYYAATLVVPASGVLKVPIKLSDDLTNFKVRVVAAAGAARFGFESSTLRVRLPVLVQPQLPRFVRQGDRFWGGGLGRLVEGAEGPGTVTLTFHGPAEAQSSNTAVSLKKGEAQSVVTRVSVASVPSDKPSELTVHMDVTRNSDQAGDAFEVKLPVLPDRSVEQFAYYETWKSGPQTLKPFPEAVRPGTAQESIVVSTVPGVLELASSLDYLIHYPYGCLEQQMSQVSPELEQLALYEKLGLGRGMREKLPVTVKKVVEQLPAHQDASGLFSYWPGGEGDLQLTGQALQFIGDVRHAGMTVDAKVEQRAVQAMEASLRTDFRGLAPMYAPETRALALLGLTHLGHADEHYLSQLYEARGSLSSTGLAYLTEAMHVSGPTFASSTKTLTSDLWDNVVFKLVKGQPTFGGISRSGTYTRGFLGSPTSTLAAVFEALLQVDPSNAHHAQMRDALVSRASASVGFGTTFDNRRGISALSTYLEQSREESGRASVSLGTGLPVSLDPQHKAARLDSTGEILPTVRTTGTPIGARVSYRYLPAAPGEQVAARAQGFIVARSTTLLAAGKGASLPEDDVHGKTQKLAVGDVAEIHARLTTDEDRYQVALVVPFAAGVEPLNPALDNASSDAKPSQPDSITADYVQRLDHEVRYFFLHLPRGTHSFHFRVRATVEGSFVHPAPYAEAMYHPEFRGRGEGMRWVVTGPHEK